MTPMTPMTLRISTDGMVTMIYKDEARPLMNALGTIKTIERASHVEWEEDGWTVRAAHDTELAVRHDRDGNIITSRKGEIVKFGERADALSHEVANFWNIIPE